MQLASVTVLVAKEDLETDNQARQAIRELVDLRLIHLVDHNTSKAPSDGRRYEAYILDIGLYDNSRPRKFSQVEPGQRDSKARKDALRASPVVSLQKLNEPTGPAPAKVRPVKSKQTEKQTPKESKSLQLEMSFE